MKLTSVDLEDEELKILARPDTFFKKIGFEDTRLSKKLRISIKYDYLDLENTSYHFYQEFHLKDTQRYFEIMKELSSKTINELEESPRELHFYRNKINGNLRAMLKAHIPNALSSEAIIYHFALYTNKDILADRGKDIRSPRIYFMLGTNGFIYPIFFDPYHEINP